VSERAKLSEADLQWMQEWADEWASTDLPDMNETQMARLALSALAEIRESRQLLTPRIVEVDETNCTHNSEIDPDTGKCLTCGAYV
jgi:hypothetical protein